MQWILSTILGLVIAWVILAFVGPVQPQVSYYAQAPVSPTPLSELDKIMEAVGLMPSTSPAPSPAPVAIMSVSEVPKSVADIATDQAASPSPSQVPQAEEPADQGTASTPQPAAPTSDQATLFQ